MGLDIGGNSIIKSGTGVALNSLVFNAAGQGAANPIPGYNGWQAGGANFYSAPAGWVINTASWQSSLNLSNGVFTCPVAGIYAMGYNDLHKGGSGIPAGLNTYGYSAFAKNGVMQYHVHWNQATGTYWNTGGTSALFSCAAGDTLALFVNRSPVSVGPDCVSQNLGAYPNEHHAIWCKLVG